MRAAAKIGIVLAVGLAMFAFGLRSRPAEARRGAASAPMAGPGLGIRRPGPPRMPVSEPGPRPEAALAIGITKTADLQFGKFTRSSAGTVIVTPAGTRSSTGGVTPFGGGVSAAAFDVSGTPLTVYTITLPASASISDGASHSMAVDTFASTPSGTGSFGAGGHQTLQVGGTLHVAANQATGSYTGTFDVTVTGN